MAKSRYLFFNLCADGSQEFSDSLLKILDALAGGNCEVISAVSTGVGSVQYILLVEDE